jgi:hypothetical protein
VKRRASRSLGVEEATRALYRRAYQGQDRASSAGQGIKDREGIKDRIGQEGKGRMA